MTEIWQIWLFLVAIGAINYFLRIIPLLIPHQWKNDINNPLIIFLEYAVFAIIGGVISSALFNGVSDSGLNESVNIHNIIKVLTILGVFTVYLFIKQFIWSFLLGLIFYQILNYFFV